MTGCSAARTARARAGIDRSVDVRIGRFEAAETLRWGAWWYGTDARDRRLRLRWQLAAGRLHAADPQDSRTPQPDAGRVRRRDQTREACL